MRLLLDSHVVIWWLTDASRLGPQTRSMLFDPDTDIVVSLASIWELAAKASRGSLPLPAPIVPRIVATLTGKARFLAINEAHLSALEVLPRHHGDPFDRMLIAQSMVEGLTLATADGAITKYALLRHDAES